MNWKDGSWDDVSGRVTIDFNYVLGQKNFFSAMKQTEQESDD